MSKREAEEINQQPSKISKKGCAQIGCTVKWPCFNIVTEKKGLYCKQHSLAGMVNVEEKRKCIHPNCAERIRPSFNFVDMKRGIYCEMHKLPGMVNVSKKRCLHPDCKDGPIPLFNEPGKTTGIYCFEHKSPSMVIVIDKRKCLKDECIVTRPRYNLPGQTTGQYCRKHKSDFMVDVVCKTCKHAECKIRPSFNFPGYELGVYCAKHRLKGMEDVVNKRCEDELCESLRPCFNFKGEKRGIYCVKHQKPNMVDVLNKRCIDPSCSTTQPSFNYKNEKRGLYCASHRKEGMVNVTDHRHCEHQGCEGKRPIYNFPGEKHGKFCINHRLENMVNVVSKKCKESNCFSRANFAKPGCFSTFCAVHRKPGDIFKPRRRCEFEKCKEIAIYGMNSEPKFCEAHKSPEHLNLVYQVCIICNVLEHVDDEMKCSRCSNYLKKKLYCRKQRLVKSWLDTEPDFPMYKSYDRQIDGGACGKERPDFMWETPSHCVILEVDEFQHKNTPCECEQVRMANVTSSLGMPCLWIRFNPDEYTGSKNLTDKQRRDLLIRVLKQAFSSLPTNQSEYCRVQHLCFDGFNILNIPKINVPVM